MSEAAVRKSVAGVISSVRRSGDGALIALTKKYDRVSLRPSTIRVPASEISGALAAISTDTRRALESCARRIQDFHWQEKKHITQSWTYARDGVRVGQIYNPVEAVGIYAPGGRFSYPSTVLMTAIPARLAGVGRIALVTPPGRLKPELLAAAKIAGVDEVYRVGGPAAIAALAVGTKTIPKVDLIVGPGNAYVTEAKRQLFGEVGIDLLAGPSELVVLADDSAEAEWIAGDMAAQAEHGPDSSSVLVSLSRDLAKRVKGYLPKNVLKQCSFFVESDRARAIRRVNELAGEHVEIQLRNAQDCLDTIKNGGTIFIGGWSPTALGDYWAGPSHVLPTGRSARFDSGLSVMTFLKRSSLVDVSQTAYRKGWTAALKVAEVEGLVLHAESLKVRVRGKS